MFSRQVKNGIFVLEALNSFAVTYYFYYLYFFMHSRFGFDNKANLLLAAWSGLVYVPAALLGGRFGQRSGYFNALKLGFAIMAGSLLIGAQLDSAAGHILVMTCASIGMCFTWPTLEALVSEGETPRGLQRNVGLYNVIWAGTNALAYFMGGAMLEKFGSKSLFYVPAALLVSQLALTLWLERAAKRVPPGATAANPASERMELNPRPISRARTFLSMAWLANPFSYIALNTLIAVMPGLAQRLQLSTTLAGFCGSVWCFARLGAFLGLWFWPGWHYQFRWMLVSFITMIATFALIPLVPNLAVLITAQLLLGAAVGLIYYSSLFYSMDVGETKGEHGGVHEAMIGLGNFIGPAVGAASLHFLPHHAHSGAVAVTVLLLCGLGGLMGIFLKAPNAKGDVK